MDVQSVRSVRDVPQAVLPHRIARDVIDPPSDASMWGDRVHKSLEAYVKDGTPLPDGMQQWEPLMKKITAMPGDKYTEHKFALTTILQPAEWDDSWARGIGDLYVEHGNTAAILDYKTGRRKLTDQLKVYACMAMFINPEIDVVNTGFVWLKDKTIDREVVKRQDIPSIWKGIMLRHCKISDARDNNHWPANPSGLCRRWCPCTQCDFNGR